MPLFFAHNIVIFLFILFILFITVSSNTSKLVLVFFSPRFPPPCFFPFHFVHVTPKQRHLLPKKAKMKEINKTEWAGRTDFSQENFYRARNLCFQRILTRCRGKGKNKGHFFFCFWGKVALNIFGVCVWGGESVLTDVTKATATADCVLITVDIRSPKYAANNTVSTAFYFKEFTLFKLMRSS